MIQESRLLQGSDGKLQGYDTFGNEMGFFIYSSIQSVRQPVHSAVDALNTWELSKNNGQIVAITARVPRWQRALSTKHLIAQKVKRWVQHCSSTQLLYLADICHRSNTCRHIGPFVTLLIEHFSIQFNARRTMPACRRLHVHMRSSLEISLFLARHFMLVLKQK